MKKVAVLLFAVCMISTSVFALDLGAGGTIDYSHVYGFSKSDYTIEIIPGLPMKTKNTTATNYNMLGFKGFFDAQYAVATIGINTSIGKIKNTTKNDFGTTSSKTDIKLTFFNIGILGKYPFSIGNINLFPLAGFDFDLIVASKKDGNKVELDSETKKELNNVWLDLGLGADIPVALDGKLCVRPQGIFGIKLNRSKTSKQLKEIAKTVGGKYSDGAVKFNLGVGVIYKF